MTLTMALAILALLLALPSLVWRRRNAWLLRLASLLVVAALALGLGNLPGEESQLLQPPVLVLPTAAAPLLQSELPPHAQVLAGQGRLRQRLAEARLAAAGEPAVLLWWNGSFSADAADAAESTAGGNREMVQAIVPGQPAPVDPATISLRLLSPLQQGRPAALELRLGEQPKALTLSGWMEISDPQGLPVWRQEFQLGAKPLQLDFLPESQGTHSLSLHLAMDDLQLTGQAELLVQAPKAMALVGAKAAELAAALEVQGMPVQVHARLPEQLPEVVLVLDPLSPKEQQALLLHVDAGGGLFLVGRAMPEAGEPLHSLLPVHCLAREALPQDPSQPEPKDPPPEIPEPAPEQGEEVDPSLEIKDPELAEVQRRQVAMVLVLDLSGSMGARTDKGQRRIDLAKDSVRKTVAALQADDLWSLVTFAAAAGSEPRRVFPLLPVGDGKAVGKTLQTLPSPDGGTFLARALDAAREMLHQSKAPVKQVVVLTDGVIHDSQEMAPIAALQLAQDKVGFALIQILADDDIKEDPRAPRDAKNIADRAGGRYVLHSDFGAVPRLVMTEVERVLVQAGEEEKKPEPTPESDPEPEPELELAIETPPAPALPLPLTLAVRAVAESALLQPRPDAGFPSLGGMLPVRGRIDSQTLLVAGQEGLPLLAFANRGLGRVGVWTADFMGNWGGAWRQHSSFPAWLAQWVQSLQPPLPSAEALVLLENPKLHPAMPVPGELAELESLAATFLQSPAAYQPPVAVQQDLTQGQAREHALYAIFACLFLVLVEYLYRRRSMRPELKP